jgi:hypothetical protein
MTLRAAVGCSLLKRAAVSDLERVRMATGRLHQGGSPSLYAEKLPYAVFSCVVDPSLQRCDLTESSLPGVCLNKGVQFSDQPRNATKRRSKSWKGNRSSTILLDLKAEDKLALDCQIIHIDKRNIPWQHSAANSAPSPSNLRAPLPSNPKWRPTEWEPRSPFSRFAPLPRVMPSA